jgi:hypothetical protein
MFFGGDNSVQLWEMRNLQHFTRGEEYPAGLLD